MSEVPSDHPDWKRLEDALETLSEFFTAVHIFAVKTETADEGGDGVAGDLAFSSGRGSYYQRLGFIREWVIRQDERSRLKESE